MDHITHLDESDNTSFKVFDFLLTYSYMYTYMSMFARTILLSYPI